ncbi:ClpXP protease specificity-enhancing factor [Hydrogenophaga sp.]|uniref:ClpXP protease specificity-enhancing factor n=1 Tax=Hydrogenophaga sp. TaxID=1904254 RepID=UPI0019876E44|nr:ClpXP protease specificity-enhancing factor [Hydrogenophaga sp.]MBD3892441.1 ClpXP protease specificity-enhancing factor [Hydrogenophaga sp.]
MISSEQELPSTRPYLIRALHEWCTDLGYAPHIVVQVDGLVRVPLEFVKNGEIVLNLSLQASNALRLGNEYIEFKARFGGVVRDIQVPVSHVTAIYARENGQGMAFPAPPALPDQAAAAPDSRSAAAKAPAPRNSLRAVPAQPSDGESVAPEPPDPPPGSAAGAGTRPALKRVK